jgi:uncharacterized protein YukE
LYSSDPVAMRTAADAIRGSAAEIQQAGTQLAGIAQVGPSLLGPAADSFTALVPACANAISLLAQAAARLAALVGQAGAAYQDNEAASLRSLT